MGFKDVFNQIEDHLNAPRLSFLFGAGVSYSANIPLMYPLTDRVFEMIREHEESQQYYDILNAIRLELGEPENSTSTADANASKSEDASPSPRIHIEHILSHLGDYASLLGRRAKKGALQLTADINITEEDIDNVYGSVLGAIAETIRWGYKAPTAEDAAEIGSVGKPIIDIKEHLNFVDACFYKARANTDIHRPPVRIFTTNYDTLLEDALALERVPYWDGFQGGAIAYKRHGYGDKLPHRFNDKTASERYKAYVVKLHGSIDWRLDKDSREIFRVRYRDNYPTWLNSSTDALIYPQATKYQAAQRDPFAAHFEIFRNALREREGTLAICGYSYGDEHINDEIELAMNRSDCSTTILAFTDDASDLTEKGNPSVLSRWIEEPWADRLYVITPHKIYSKYDCKIPPSPLNKDGKPIGYAWWTYDGLSRVITDGMSSLLSDSFDGDDQ